MPFALCVFSVLGQHFILLLDLEQVCVRLFKRRARCQRLSENLQCLIPRSVYVCELVVWAVFII